MAGGFRSIVKVAAAMCGPLVVLLFASGLMSTRATAADLEPEGRDSGAIAAAIGCCQPGDTLRLPAGTFDLSE